MGEDGWSGWLQGRGGGMWSACKVQDEGRNGYNRVRGRGFRVVARKELDVRGMFQLQRNGKEK